MVKKRGLGKTLDALLAYTNTELKTLPLETGSDEHPTGHPSMTAWAWVGILRLRRPPELTAWARVGIRTMH